MLRDVGSRDKEFIELVRGIRRRLLELGGVSQAKGFEAVLVLRAQARQVNHERGRMLCSVVEVLRRKDSGRGIVEDWQSGDLLGAHEVRAALVLTRAAAKDLSGIARDLAVRLPAVLDAVVCGVLDEARARVFRSVMAWASGSGGR